MAIINPGRWGARAKPSTLDTAHNPPPLPERAKFPRTARAGARRYYSQQSWYPLGRRNAYKCIHWMKSVIWRHLLEHTFFYNRVIILREHLKRSICQGHCVYFKTLAATIHTITSGLWLIQKKLNDKGAYFFHRISCSNICLKNAVLYESTCSDSIVCWWMC